MSILDKFPYKRMVAHLYKNLEALRELDEANNDYGISTNEDGTIVRFVKSVQIQLEAKDNYETATEQEVREYLSEKQKAFIISICEQAGL